MCNNATDYGKPFSSYKKGLLSAGPKMFSLHGCLMLMSPWGNIEIRVNAIYGYHYWASTWLRYERFENRLDLEPQVGTQICPKFGSYNMFRKKERPSAATNLKKLFNPPRVICYIVQLLRRQSTVTRYNSFWIMKVTYVT